jgi:DNA-binding Lrp family transcriptional regulator
MKHELDEIDKQIIELKQTNAEITNLEIANIVKRSQPAIGARLFKLEKFNFLVKSFGADVLKIDWKIFYVYLKVKPQCQFWNEFERCPHIANILNTTGEYNYILQFVIEDIEKLNKIIEYCIGKNPMIISYKIEAIIGAIKPYISNMRFLDHCSLFNPLKETPICPIWNIKKPL